MYFKIHRWEIAILAIFWSVVFGGPGCSPTPYGFYWNVGSPWAYYTNVSQYGIFPANYTQTGSACTISGCSRWQQGIFPYYDDNGTAINGGIPQLGNLDEHLKLVAEQVVGWIPDHNWSGLAVIDFEAWSPIWDSNTQSTNSWHGKIYQTASTTLVKNQHPDWSQSAIEAQAKIEFQSAGIKYFVQTLQTAKGIRPNAKWGFYGFPPNYDRPCVTINDVNYCGYDVPNTGDVYRGYNDEVIDIWKSSNALYPSIYLPPGLSSDILKSYINSTVKEAIRCSNTIIPVFPFHMNIYHNHTTFLSKIDLESCLTIPAYYGAAGVVIWGSSSEMSEFPSYVSSTLGPLTFTIVRDSCSCSINNCSSHGRCENINRGPCSCYPGYTGEHCQDNRSLKIKLV